MSVDPTITIPLVMSHEGIHGYIEQLQFHVIVLHRMPAKPRAVALASTSDFTSALVLMKQPEPTSNNLRFQTENVTPSPAQLHIVSAWAGGPGPTWPGAGRTVTGQKAAVYGVRKERFRTGSSLFRTVPCHCANGSAPSQWCV